MSTNTELRELDALVAEKVLGWPPRPKRSDLWWYATHHCGESGYRSGEDYCPKCHGVNAETREALEIERQYNSLPLYSSSWEAAAEVIERVCVGNVVIEMHYSLNGFGKYRWWVVISKEESYGTITLGESACATGPEAICRASLAALEAAHD